MDDTFFYYAGGALIVLALLLSLTGMRSDKFPSNRLLPIGIVLITLLVGATAYGAVKLSQSEEAERLEEANLEGDAESSAQDATNQDAGSAPADTPAGTGTSQKDLTTQDSGTGSAPDPSQVLQGGGGTGSSIDGGQVFVSTGCGNCHSLEALGTDAQGTIGPSLDAVLANKDAKFIEESIVSPSAYVEKGYPDGTMPQNYESELSPEELQAVVDFLVQSTSDDSGAPHGDSSSSSTGN